MTKKVLLATNNLGKVERFRKLVKNAGLDVQLLIPSELGLSEIDVVEDGKTLAENAEIKARAYFGKVDIPILANDTGFWLSTAGFVLAPKREAIQGEVGDMSKEELAEKVLTFWKQKATDSGGEVDAAWIESFVLLDPDGQLRESESRREAVLTDKEFGQPPVDMPIRALYISKTTNIPAVLHTEAEEWIEMQPIVVAFKKLFVT